MIEKILHYTSLKNWKKIQRDGVLKPLSEPLFYQGNISIFEEGLRKGLTLDEIAATFKVPEYLLLSEKAKAVIRKDATYLTGIPAESIGSWLHEEGLLAELGLHIMGKGADGMVVLEVPVLSTEGSFVRDHKAINPQRWYSADQEGQRHLRQEYLDSSTPLAEYQGNFQTPEVWLLQKTPHDRIKMKKRYMTSLQKAKDAVESIKDEARRNMWAGFL